MKKRLNRYTILLLTWTLLTASVISPAIASPQGATPQSSIDLSKWLKEAGEQIPLEEHELLLANVTDPAADPDAATVTDAVYAQATAFEAGVGVIEKISVPVPGLQNHGSSGTPSVSVDGRYVVFDSNSSSLTQGDNNGWSDIFVHDRETKATTRITSEADGSSYNPVISMDGRFILFATEAYNLFDENDWGEEVNLFLYDRESGEFRVVAKGVSEEAFGAGRSYALSADGRYAAFWSYTSNGVKDDLNNNWDLFLKDIHTGWITRITASPYSSVQPEFSFPRVLSMTADGQQVAFDSDQSNLVEGDTNAQRDVFVYSALTDQVERVSVSTEGSQGEGASESPSISPDGRYIAFASNAANLAAGGNAYGNTEIFVRDRIAGTTDICLPAASDVSQKRNPVISAGGRLVLYTQTQNGTPELRLYNRLTRESRWLSVNTAGNPGGLPSQEPFLSADGRYAVFTSDVRDFTPVPDSDYLPDIFITPLEPQVPGAIPAWPENAALTIGQIGGSFAYLEWPAAQGVPDAVYRVTVTDKNGKRRIAITRDTHFLVTGLAIAESYSFEVAAGNAYFDFGLEFITATAQTGLPDHAPPGKVTGLTVQPGSGVLSVSWTDPADPDLSGIRVEWKKAGAPLYASLPVIRSGVQRAMLTGIAAKQLYDVRVMAIDTEGNESESSQTLVSSGDGRVVSRISISQTGEQMTKWDGSDEDRPLPQPLSADVSDDGRYLVFSGESSLWPDSDDVRDRQIYLYDRQTHSLQLISQSKQWGPGWDESWMPRISGNGRFIVFVSEADNLVRETVDSPMAPSIFLYDRDQDNDMIFDEEDATSMKMISPFRSFYDPNLHTFTDPSISDDGSRILFRSYEDSYPFPSKIYLYRRELDTMEPPEDEEPREEPLTVLALPSVNFNLPQISGDGRYFAVETPADLDARDPDGYHDVYLIDLDNLQAEWVSDIPASFEGAIAPAQQPSVSDDGRYVAFSFNTDEQTKKFDLYVYDRTTKTARLIAHSGKGNTNRAKISGDGSVVVYQGYTEEYSGFGTNVFAYHLDSDETETVSLSFDGRYGDRSSSDPAVNDNGTVAAFVSESGNLVTGDSNFMEDVFYTELSGSPANEDRMAPTWPDGAAAEMKEASHNSVTLKWPQATDDQGIASYQIFRGNDPVASASGSELEKTIGGLQPDTAYTFTIVAVDGAGNRSAGLTAEAKTLEAPVNDELRILEAKATAPVKYKSYVKIGDTITITMKGDTASQAEAKIEYLKPNGETGETIVSMSEITSNNYRGSFEVIEGMAEIKRIQTRLAKAGKSAALDAQMKTPLLVGGSVRFELDPLLAERLKGGYIAVTSAGMGISANVVTDGGVTYQLQGLPAGSQGTDYAIRAVSADGYQAILTSDSVNVKIGTITEARVQGEMPASLVWRLISDTNSPSRAYVRISTNNRMIFSDYATVNGSNPFAVSGLQTGEELTVTIEPEDLGLKPTFLTYTVTDTGTNIAEFEVGTRAQVTLRGQVTDNTGHPVANAVVAAYQYVTGRPVQKETRSDQDGMYTLQMYEGTGNVSARYVQIGHTETESVTLEAGRETRQDLAFKDSLPGTLQLDIYTKHAGGQWSGPLDLDWRVLVHFRYRSTHAQRGEPDGSLIPIRSKPGEQVRMCVNGVESGLPAACGETTMDERNRGKIEIRLEDTGAEVRGRLEHGGTHPVYSVTLYATDEEGKRTWITQKTVGQSFTLDVPKPGSYAMTVTASGGYSAVRNFDIAAGELEDLGTIRLPEPGTYAGQSGNEILLAPSEVLPGGLLQVRTLYKNSGNASTADTRLIVPVPAGTLWAESGVTVNGQPASVEAVDKHSMAISLGTVAAKAGGVVSYYLRLSDDYREPFVLIAPGMTFSRNGGQVTELLGQTAASVTLIKLEAPSITGRKDLPVRGLAKAGSFVRIYDGDRLLGETIASAAGTWQKTIRLTEAERSSSHRLRAEAELGSQRWLTEETPVIYQFDHPEVTQVKLSQSGERSVSFDPGQGTAVFPYVYVPGRSFSVSLSFQNDQRVSGVRVIVGNGESAMSNGGNGTYHAVVTPSSPGPVYVKYMVAKNVSFAHLPTTEEYQGQIPEALQDIHWTKKNVTQSQQNRYALNASYGGSVQVKGKDVEISTDISFEEVDYIPTGRDETYTSATGITLHGFSMNYSISGKTISYSLTGYIPEEKFREIGASGSLEQLIGAMGPEPVKDPSQKIKKVKAAGAVVKAVKATYKGFLKLGDDYWDAYEFYDDVSDTQDNTDKLKQLEKLLDLIADRCDPSAANQYREWANSIANKYMAQEVVKWAMLAGSAAVAPATFGIGTLLLFAASEVMEAVMDRAIDLEIEDLKNRISNDDRCEEDPEEERKKVADPKWIYDPSGYVYEVEESNRIEGVTATAMYWDESDRSWKVWDAEWYGQKNPLTTDQAGKYAWDVPEGKWKVVYQKDGYIMSESRELTVLPPHTDVNIAMESILPPKVLDAIAGRELTHIDIWFDRHVDHASLNDLMATVSGVGAEGETIELEGSIQPVDPVSYKGRTVSKKFRFVTEQLKDVVSAEVRLLAGIESYRGAPMLDEAVVSVKMQDLPPAKAVDVRTVATSNGMVIEWTDPDDPDFKEVVVEWKESGDATFVNRLTVVKGVQMAILDFLAAATAYDVVLHTVDHGGGSSATEIEVTTSAESRIPDLIAPEPVAHAAAVAEASSVRVTWEELDFAGDLDQIRVQWRAANGGNTSATAEVDKGVRSYTITGLAASTEYEISVSAVDQAGNTSAGALLSAVTGRNAGTGQDPIQPPPNAPNMYPVSESGGEIQAFEGAVKLLVPAAAFDAKTELEIIIPGEITLDDEKEWRVLSKGYQWKEKKGQQPKKPVRLSLQYDSSELRGADPKKLGIYRKTDKPGQWEYVGGRVDAVHSVIEANVKQSGVYAVLLFDRTFADLRNHWSKPFADVVISRHIFSGTDKQLFEPERAITRAEFIKTLVALVSKQGTLPDHNPSAVSFSDVPVDSWYHKYVTVASQWGLVKGDKGKFRPNDPITREEVTLLVMKTVELLGKKTSSGPVEDLLRPYADGRNISSWARAAFARAIEAGIVAGVDKQHLKPRTLATRAQAAVFMNRLLSYLHWL